MLTFYRPKYFRLQELVPQWHYEHISSSILWRQLDPRLLWTLDNIREHFRKATYLNRWLWVDDGWQYCCWRPSGCPVGSEYSQHKYGRAADPKVAGMTHNELKAELIKRQFEDKFKYITRMELDVAHTHIDTANVNRHSGIVLFHP